MPEPSAPVGLNENTMSDMAITAKWSDFSDLDGETLLAAANERLPRWVTFGLVIAIAWQLSKIVWMLVPASSAGDPIAIPSSQASSATVGARGNQPSVNVIADAHLFGEAKIEDAGPVVASTNIDTLPDARVSLALKGTVAASDPSSSYAIIADSNKEKKVYKIGDPVQAGTTLQEIHLDLVVLNQNGALSKLRLPKDFPRAHQACVDPRRLLIVPPAVTLAAFKTSSRKTSASWRMSFGQHHTLSVDSNRDTGFIRAATASSSRHLVFGRVI